MKSYLAEVLGTFLLVFIGTASVVTGGFGGALPLGQEGIGLAFGIGLIAAAYAIGPISGAHLNPAVTLGVFLAGRMPAKDVIPYWIAQIIGAIIASLALWLIVSGQVGGHTGGFGANGWDETKWGIRSAFLWELIGTFTFVTVILGVTSGKHTTAFVHRRRGYQPALAVHRRSADRRRHCWYRRQDRNVRERLKAGQARRLTGAVANFPKTKQARSDPRLFFFV